MAYTPTEWNCGDTITAEKLNKLEQGLADCCGGGSSGTLMFTYTEEELPATEECPDGSWQYTCSHSWQEIHDALASGTRVVKMDIYHTADEDIVEALEVRRVSYSHGTYLVDDFEFADATSKVFVFCGMR